mgnify:CR=1 FL=1
MTTRLITSLCVTLMFSTPAWASEALYSDLSPDEAPAHAPRPIYVDLGVDVSAMGAEIEGGSGYFLVTLTQAITVGTWLNQFIALEGQIEGGGGGFTLFGGEQSAVVAGARLGVRFGLPTTFSPVATAHVGYGYVSGRRDSRAWLFGDGELLSASTFERHGMDVGVSLGFELKRGPFHFSVLHDLTTPVLQSVEVAYSTGSSSGSSSDDGLIGLRVGTRVAVGWRF